MFEKILDALKEFALGEPTKDGFTRLELLLARITQDTQFDPVNFAGILSRLVSMDQAGDEDFAMGIALIADKIKCHDPLLCNALEKKLFDSDGNMSARSEFELASLYIASGGNFTPPKLELLTKLKNEKPSLWLDLVLQAYPNDLNGLQDVIVSLLSDEESSLHWSALKPRYLKLAASMTSGKFDSFASAIAKIMDINDRKEFLAWLTKKRVPQVVEKIPDQSHSPQSASLTQPEDIHFLRKSSGLAKRIAA